MSLDTPECVKTLAAASTTTASRSGGSSGLVQRKIENGSWDDLRAHPLTGAHTDR